MAQPRRADGPDSQAETSLHRIVLGYLHGTLDKQHRHDVLPVAITSDSTTGPAAEDIAIPEPAIPDYAVLYPLRSEDEWRKFHRAFVLDRTGSNLKPWYRCIGILRGLEAKTAVVERHYVCLDQRSEFASFYSHLDAPRRNSTIRVHFFSQPLREADLLALRREELDSYLGYLVLREGNVPLVGRSVIQVPAYADVSTAIQEPVNLFGQDLTVVGVPFMQQDQRFAVCAHIAAWVAHYSAFRKGLFERRLIADFVNVSNSFTPMRPKQAGGLTVPELTRLLDELGFRSIAYSTPWADASDIPGIGTGELPKVAEALGMDTNKPISQSLYDNLSGRAVDQLGDYIAEVLQADAARSKEADPAPDSVSADASPYHQALPVKAFESVLHYIVDPYIRSGWPVYAGTKNHAVVVCGRATVEGDAAYVVHDDQNGPYLVATSLTFLSKEGLRYQSGRYSAGAALSLDDVPPVDRVLGALRENSKLLTGEDYDRAVHSIVVPLPPRVLLAPIDAQRAALRLLSTLIERNEATEQVSSPVLATLKAAQPRVTILMGIDFKSDRRLKAAARGDDLATLAYSCMHLAEWVIVVEGVSTSNEALWEVVFDASSNPDRPRIQLARVLRTLLADDPKGRTDFRGVQIGVDGFRAIEAPRRLKKWTAKTPPKAT